MRALITGIGGFVGRHLQAHLCQQGDEVVGIGRPGDTAGVPDQAQLFAADLLDRAAVQRVLAQVRPDLVYHLAAQASAGESLDDPWTTVSNNMRCQMNLFEALLAVPLRPRILIVGSGDEYGRVRPHEVPTDEDVPLRPTTPYGVSKVGQDVMGHQYYAQHGLPVVRVRPFNHTGPGQDGRFAIPSFAHQLAQIETGQREPVLRVGNLDVWRDFTDVRDMVRAYRLAILAGAPGEVYNLGRGSSVRIADVVAALIGLCRVPARAETDRRLVRPTDVPRQEANIRKFHALTGWEPVIPWHDTLRQTLEYWRERVAGRPLSTARPRPTAGPS